MMKATNNFVVVVLFKSNKWSKLFFLYQFVPDTILLDSVTFLRLQIDNPIANTPYMFS